MLFGTNCKSYCGQLQHVDLIDNVIFHLSVKKITVVIITLACS